MTNITTKQAVVGIAATVTMLFTGAILGSCAAEPPIPSPPHVSTQQVQDEKFLAYVKTDDTFAMFSDATLLKLGNSICKVYEAGGTEDMVIETFTSNNFTPAEAVLVSTAAQADLCPDTLD